jgi:hypothetical protein
MGMVVMLPFSPQLPHREAFLEDTGNIHLDLSHQLCKRRINHTLPVTAFNR